MRIFRHYTELPAAVRGGVVALGNFDGVHLGHQQVIGTAQEIARQRGLPCGVMTFEPHPRSVFKPDQPAFRLTPFRIKARLIEQMGLDFLVMQHFDHAFAAHSAEEFIEDALLGGLGAAHVVVGYDYVFGHDRKGDGQLLQTAGEAKGFGVTRLQAVTAEDGEAYSSTRVREYLVTAQPDQAARLLGRDWEIEGRVEHGDARGRLMGFPTANVEMADYQRPANGVYAVFAGIDTGTKTEWRPGVANFGRRPTFGKDSRLLEVHLFDFDGDLYGRHLRVALVAFLRPEHSFDGMDSLKAQIAQDCQKARTLLAQRRGP